MLKLNLTKCSILSVKRKDPILYDYYIKENTRDMQLERCGKVKDLGVIIDSKLTFKDHITEQESCAIAKMTTQGALYTVP